MVPKSVEQKLQKEKRNNKSCYQYQAAQIIVETGRGHDPFNERDYLCFSIRFKYGHFSHQTRY
jgi:hypothetical protein